MMAIDFKAFQQVHHNHPPEWPMTMMTFRTDNPPSCGIVELDEHGIVKGFNESSQAALKSGQWGGVYPLNQIFKKTGYGFTYRDRFQHRSAESIC